MPAPAIPNVNGIHIARPDSSATAQPLTGVFETLVDQHRQVLDLLRRAGSTDDPTKRRERWAEARRRLLSHERAEEQVVYALLEGQDAAQPLLERHGDQAVELELAAVELDATEPDSDAWIEQLRDMMAMVDDHVRDEEADFFPRAQRLLGENMARELEDPYVNAQRDVLHTLA